MKIWDLTARGMAYAGPSPTKVEIDRKVWPMTTTIQYIAFNHDLHEKYAYTFALWCCNHSNKEILANNGSLLYRWWPNIFVIGVLLLPSKILCAPNTEQFGIRPTAIHGQRCLPEASHNWLSLSVSHAASYCVTAERCRGRQHSSSATRFVVNDDIFTA